ncbi:MAG TPA: glycoside hydrolase family 99-like domain-containing protein [Candidatus Hydrogenedentes bacterium]|nr:glycoside hydrolase family 99-like domain-containing protein [Candidatus Hydrogenedentota bacterium]
MFVPLFLSVLATVSGLPSWEFDSPADLQIWQPNAQLADVAIRDGVVHARTTDWDPFFTCRDLDFPATSWQYVVVRLKASQPGNGELFWSKDLEGKYGGLSQEKSTPFKVRGNGQWEDITILPFWQKEGTIRQLRLDLYDDTQFDIDWIRILEWGEGRPPLTDGYVWNFDGGSPVAWRIHEGCSDFFAPPLDLPLGSRGWVNVRLSAGKDAEGAVLWAAKDTLGAQSESFTLRGDGQFHTYTVEVASYPAWGERITAFGLRLPEDALQKIESVSITEAPEGPGEMVVSYFGFENGVNRAGRNCRILAQFENTGGSACSLENVQLHVPQSVRIMVSPEKTSIGPVEFKDIAELVWEVMVDAPGTYAFSLSSIPELPENSQMALTFLESLNLPKADYVPEPKPVQTDIEVCMYYFPGWGSEAKWDCIRQTAPVRKPLLGYYDESRADIVDWQIKWAAENGVKCYLVDWYWVKGNQHLTHWFEAYRKAKYRDLLHVAIMWANHNPPGSHSMEDWRKVNQEWIDRYFNLPSYYRLNGKPALFFWDPNNLRNDLGGSEGAKAALAESQAMAQAAGYPGVEFVAVNNDQSPALVKLLEDEGYAGATNYHEWGRAVEMSPTPKRARYEDVVATAPENWAKRDAMSSTLTYYPLVDTGWDSRPWHGSKSLVIGGRTVALFERILRDVKTFSEARGKRMVVLGPSNEWGEGSYVEPCTEYDFGMMEAIRNVFAKGDPASWPVNIGPAEVGLGPYDFPPLLKITSWEFDQDAGGWNAMMGVADLRCENGCLYFKTTTDDPAIHVSVDQVLASDFPNILVRMKLTGSAPKDISMQLFWSMGGGGTSEAASISFPAVNDGEFHEYTLDLKSRPRWRGRIAGLRFDPGSVSGLEVYIDRIALEK